MSRGSSGMAGALAALRSLQFRVSWASAGMNFENNRPIIILIYRK